MSAIPAAGEVPEGASADMGAAGADPAEVDAAGADPAGADPAAADPPGGVSEEVGATVETASAFSRVPHSKQNADVSAFSWPQFGQRMGPRVYLVGSVAFRNA